MYIVNYNSRSVKGEKDRLHLTDENNSTLYDIRIL